MSASLKKIVNEFTELCEAHDEIKFFEYGEFLDIIKSEAVQYTCAMLNCINVNFDPARNKTTYILDVMVMDKIFKDRANNDDVENQTLLIIEDLVGVIWRSDRWQDFGEWTSISPANKFIEKGADVVTGWGVTMTFDVIHGFGFCDSPITDYDFGGGVTAGCSVFTMVENTATTLLVSGTVSGNDNTLTVPDISFTDSDGSVSTVPAGVDLVCTPSGVCADATVSNSDDSYSTTVASGGDLELPDISFTDSDGTVTSEPSVVDLVCTPQVKELTVAIPYSEDDTNTSITILASAVGTITSADTTGLTSVVYELNAVVVTVPFALALSDVLEITYDTASADGVIELAGSYV